MSAVKKVTPDEGENGANNPLYLGNGAR